MFGVVKRSFTQCLWKGHTHRSNIMFQCDLHYQCCACTTAVLKCYGVGVQSPPPPAPRGATIISWTPPTWGGTVTTLGGGLQGGQKVGFGEMSDEHSESAKSWGSGVQGRMRHRQGPGCH